MDVRRVARSVCGLELMLLAVDGVDGLLGDVPLLVVMALDGEDDEHEGQDAEDQGLDRVEHDLQADRATGMIAMVRAVMTPSATSPP